MTRAAKETAARIDGREAAYRAVLAAFAGQEFVSERLAGLRRAGRLDPREAALAMQIALGAVRHVSTIRHVLATIAEYDESRVRPPLRAILYSAAYQIIWMDRIPPFAAVDQAVELARRHVRGRAPGMVNGVLRRLTRAIATRRATWDAGDARQIRVCWDEACVFKTDVLPTGNSSAARIARLAAATGERPARCRVLVERFGPRQAAEIAWASQAVPVTVLHRNLLRVAAETFAARVRDELGPDVECTVDAAFLPAQAHILDAPLFREGLAYIQDTTAHAAALLVAAQPGERVLDLCAAPGGKSVVLAQQMRDRGEIIACDTVAERLDRVRENATRLGLSCIRTAKLSDGRDAGAQFGPQFDAVLVDAPCSNTGVLARRPEARLRATPGQLATLAALQTELLRSAAATVRPGGRLIYSTCSLEPDENGQIVAAFLARHTEWRLEGHETTLPHWGPRLADWRDGGFAARLVPTS